VLLILHDGRTWKDARGIAYTCGFAYEDALRARGADVTCITTPWSSRMLEVLRGSTFDQIWVQIVHAKLSEELLHWMTEAAPIRVGFVQESLEYDDAVMSMRLEYSKTPPWKERVRERGRFMTHIVACDEMDCVAINAEAGTPALWWPQAVPERFVCRDIPDVADPRAVFAGRIYTVRAEVLQHPDVRRHIWVRTSLEAGTPYPTLFNLVHVVTRLISGASTRMGRTILPAYVDMVRRIREECFSRWLETLRGGAAVISLPHTVRAYPGRVVEAMAAGRPVIAWEIPDRPRCGALFEKDKEILFYDKEKPERIAAHIERIAVDPAYGRDISTNARDRILEFHTTEKRADQILGWIDRGDEPTF
jgi:hypothetical protein